MKFFTHTVVSFLLMVCLFLIPFSVLAQPIDPCTDPADPCPIDSNLIVLMFAAVAIAAKKAYDYKKSTSAL